MLILILIDNKYLQDVVFSFEKGSNGQSHFPPDSHHPIKKSPQQNYPSLYLLALFGKFCIIKGSCDFLGESPF